MIHIERVTKRFGRVAAVADVSLRLAPGDSVALWGSNGAGKTTLLRCVLGLLRFRGRIVVGGHDVLQHGKRARQMIGYVPQELGFYDDLRVASAVRFFARLKGMTGINTAEALASVGLAGHERKRIRELSGGMKQRLALAIALLGDPAVLVLDEVTASLDALGRDDFVGLLRRISGAGRTLLFASHRLEEIGALAQRVAVLDSGRLTELVPCRDFLTGFGHGSCLHLTIPGPLRERAIVTLQREGFRSRLNDVGLLVDVAPGLRAVPIRVLTDANIRVDDLNLGPASPPEASSAAHACREEART